jgi:hypoxanthine phosphoribosyltransferase
MNSHKTTVIPFPAPSKNGLRYSAETEKRNNVIGTRLSEELKNGYSSKVMIDILTSPDVLQCGFLIEADEIFRTGETLQRNKNHVEMRDRLQEAYEALFLKTGRVDVGKMTFSNHTREYLYEAESILISDNKFDFE